MSNNRIDKLWLQGGVIVLALCRCLYATDPPEHIDLNAKTTASDLLACLANAGINPLSPDGQHFTIVVKDRGILLVDGDGTACSFTFVSTDGKPQAMGRATFQLNESGDQLNYSGEVRFLEGPLANETRPLAGDFPRSATLEETEPPQQRWVLKGSEHVEGLPDAVFNDGFELVSSSPPYFQFVPMVAECVCMNGNGACTRPRCDQALECAGGGVCRWQAAGSGEAALVGFAFAAVTFLLRRPGTRPI